MLVVPVAALVPDAERCADGDCICRIVVDALHLQTHVEETDRPSLTMLVRFVLDLEPGEQRDRIEDRRRKPTTGAVLVRGKASSGSLSCLRAISNWISPEIAFITVSLVGRVVPAVVSAVGAVA